MSTKRFHAIYDQGLFRVAIGTPVVSLAAPERNCEQILSLVREAADKGAGLVAFPELSLSGYSNDDLFFQEALLSQVEIALAKVVEASHDLGAILVVGAPLRAESKLFNCAVAIYRSAILGVVPKSYLPNYREFYEKRQFSAAEHIAATTLRILDRDVPFGNDVIFETPSCRGFALHIEICEDLWVPIPPSTLAALAGATVLVNLSASNAIIGKADYRRLLCASQSGRCVAAYVFASAGFGESTTDLAWDGQALVYENAELLAEGDRFSNDRRLLISDVDLDRLTAERARLTSLNDCARVHRKRTTRVVVPFVPPECEPPLYRPVARFPYVPSDPSRRGERCREVFEIQVQGLAQRLRATGIERVVIGVSGGLDSAHALIVAVETLDRLGLPRSNVLAYTLPGFATSSRSREHAWQLMKSLGTTASEIDIRPAARLMLADLGHPFSRGESVFDRVFENVQAGERASHLFRLANASGALVVGTSDLSELAMGYATYGVGDQMSHYAVNASVPKTLVRYLVEWVIDAQRFEPQVCDAIRAILAAPASAELVPIVDGQTQTAEEAVGPYELQDFNLYYISRYGYAPSKVAFLAEQAWSQTYDLPTIKKWLELFLTCFIKRSQFKRSALPNGPKVGSGGSLSPRGDWRAPSDVDATTWLDELHRNVP